MTALFPYIPAKAGPQRLGNKGCGFSYVQRASDFQMVQTWVPASAGMSGQVK